MLKKHRIISFEQSVLFAFIHSFTKKLDNNGKFFCKKIHTMQVDLMNSINWGLENPIGNNCKIYIIYFYENLKVLIKCHWTYYIIIVRQLVDN